MQEYKNLQINGKFESKTSNFTLNNIWWSFQNDNHIIEQKFLNFYKIFIINNLIIMVHIHKV